MSFKENIEKILNRKKQEVDAQNLKEAEAKTLQLSLETEYYNEVSQLKVAAETFVLPLLETLGETVGHKPYVGEPPKKLYDYQYPEVYGMGGKIVYGKTKQGDVMRKEEKKQEIGVWKYPEITISLTLREGSTHGENSGDYSVSYNPGDYIRIKIQHKNGANHATVTKAPSNTELVVGTETNLNNQAKIEQFLLTAFDQLYK